VGCAVPCRGAAFDSNALAPRCLVPYTVDEVPANALAVRLTGPPSIPSGGQASFVIEVENVSGRAITLDVIESSSDVDGSAEGGTSQSHLDESAEGGTSQSYLDGSAEGGTSQSHLDGSAEGGTSQSRVEAPLGDARCAGLAPPYPRQWRVTLDSGGTIRRTSSFSRRLRARCRQATSSSDAR
jgi:hypothetical protein